MRQFEGFMHGINLGGWLSQSSLDKQHLDTFITEKDFETVKDMGFDHVRVPVDYLLVENEDGTEKTEGYTYIDNAILWCNKYKLNMILDLHKTAGYAFDEFETSLGFFDSKPLQDRFVALWEKLSSKYAKYNDFVAFEILNEIVDPDVTPVWQQISARAVNAIRKNAPDSWIIYGGAIYNSIVSVPTLNAPIDDKIVYTFHCYEPLVFTHQGAYWIDNMEPDFRIDYPLTTNTYLEETLKLDKDGTGAAKVLSMPLTSLPDVTFTGAFEKLFEEGISVAEERNVPLYCGEFGVIDLADPDATLRWIKDITSVFRKYGIGYCLWSYKKMDFGLIDEHYASVRNDMQTALNLE